MSAGLHVAVDTGGTFTDIGIRNDDGELFVWKVPSTPEAPNEAVIDGIVGGLEQIDRSPEEITRLVHGTTVATNTVLTREGGRVGLLTTRGFRDVLAIAHQDRPAIYDYRQTRPAPLISDDTIFEVDERIDADGEVLTELDEAALDQLAETIASADLDVLIVSFINAYTNGQHERAAVKRLTELNAAPVVSAATEVATEMREYDRTSTAAINAYVRPKVSTYMEKLEAGIEDLKIPSRLWVMQSNGGLLNPKMASTQSAKTVLSGLAGGVVGAANWARSLGLKNVVSFDIGGTSTDIALIRDGVPDETNFTEIDSMPLRLPSVDVHTIGAGGGSIAWLDSGGSLRVGPHSAGAVPGPISYRRGGTELTVTDAHAVLGRLGGELLGGRFELDIDAARARMEEFGKSLGLSAEECAEGIIKVITATMARGVRKVSVERGVDIRSCNLMSFGGAGPLHGADLAVELGMESAVIPPHPGIASAVGMLDAPIRHDFAHPVQANEWTRLEPLEAAFGDLQDQARREMETDEFDREWLVDARYVGQSYELTLPLEDSWHEQRRAFDEAHAERYGYSDDDAAMEIIVVRLRATIESERTREAQAKAGTGAPEPKTTRQVYIDGSWTEVDIYDRDAIPAGTSIPGPIIIDQFDTTTFVHPSLTCFCDDRGFLHLRTRKSDDDDK